MQPWASILQTSFYAVKDKLLKFIDSMKLNEIQTRNNQEKLRKMAELNYWIILLVIIKVIYEIIFTQITDFFITLTLGIFTISVVLIIKNASYLLSQNIQKSKQIFYVTTVLLTVWISHRNFPILGFFVSAAGFFNLLNKNPFFCTNTYFLSEAIFTFLQSFYMPLDKFRITFFNHFISWICFYILARFNRKYREKIQVCKTDLEYYRNASDNILNFIKRPFVVADRQRLSMALFNMPMQRLLEELNCVSFNKLADSLLVESKVIRKTKAKKPSFKREHIIYQHQPFSYNPYISLKEYLIKHYAISEEDNEKEIRLTCSYRLDTGIEKFNVLISTGNHENEIAFFFNKISTQEIIKKRRDHNKARNLLLKTLSHNIRNPLMLIQFLVDSLYNSKHLQYDNLDVLRKLKNTAELLSIKTEDLLDFAQILEGDLVLNKELVNIEDLVLSLKNLLTQYINDVDLRFHIKINEDVPKTIYTDKNRLQRVLCHISLNALKYTLKGFVVLSITYDPKKENTIFTIHDSGIGMSPEKARTIENFISSDFIDISPISYDENPSGSKEQVGTSKESDSLMNLTETGIGIYITGKLCEKLGSRLVIKGMEGHGASFSFWINCLSRKNMTIIKPNILGPINFIQTPDSKMDSIFQDGKRLEITQRKQNSHSLLESICEVPEELPEESYGGESERKIIMPDIQNQEMFYKVSQKKAHHKKQSKFAEAVAKIPKKVLVVDDQQINRFVIKEILRKIGNFEADEAINGKEALDLVESKHYNLIFMDLDMPVMNGFECVQKIREKEAMEELETHVPIIAVTAYDTPEIISQTVYIGFNEIMVKPVNLNKMKHCISRHCPGVVS